MLDKIPTLLSGAVCDEKTGWLPPGFVDQCRTILCEIVSLNMKQEILKRSEGAAEEYVDDNQDEEINDQEDFLEMEYILPDDPEDGLVGELDDFFDEN